MKEAVVPNRAKVPLFRRNVASTLASREDNRATRTVQKPRLSFPHHQAHEVSYDRESEQQYFKSHRSSSDKHYTPNEPRRVYGNIAVFPFFALSHRQVKKQDDRLSHVMFQIADANNLSYTNKTIFLKVLGVDYLSKKEKEPDLYSKDWYRFGVFDSNYSSTDPSDMIRLYDFPEYLPLQLFIGKENGDEVIFYYDFTKFTLKIDQSRLLTYISESNKQICMKFEKYQKAVNNDYSLQKVLDYIVVK